MPSAKIAEINYARAPLPMVEIVMPRRSLLKDLLKVREVIDDRVLPKLTGHEGCYSGMPLFIHEQLEQFAKVDLATGKLV